MVHKTVKIIGGKQYRLFSLFGFEVKLDLSWILLALLIAWSLGAGVFPTDYPELANRVYAWMGIACALGVLFSIVFHEFSHSFVARRFGIPIKGITLFIFGGVAEMDKEPPSARSEFIMAIAGPLASLLLAFAFSRIEALAMARSWPIPVIGVSHTLAYINTVVAIFNLVPAFPLDGGRMLRAALWYWKDDLRTATRISSRMGNGFGIVLMILGGIAFLQGNIIGGMWWFLIGLFLRGAAAASFQQLLFQEFLQGHPVRDFMTRNAVTVPPSISIQDWIDDYVYRHHVKMFPVVEDSNLLGCISVECIKKIQRTDWHNKKVRDLLEPVSDANTVSMDADSTKLLATMAQPGARARYMVVDGGRLVGMISLKDMLDIIALRLEFESPGH